MNAGIALQMNCSESTGGKLQKEVVKPPTLSAEVHFSLKFCYKFIQADKSARFLKGGATMQCPACGKPKRQPSKYYSSRGWGKFCDSHCYHRFRSMKARLIRRCASCRMLFSIKRINVLRGKGRFCSRRCHLDAMRDTCSRVSRPCGICGMMVTRPLSQMRAKQVFCSTKHAQAAPRQAPRAEKLLALMTIERVVNGVRLKCSNCGREFIRKRYLIWGAKYNFCSRRCWYSYLPKWQRPEWTFYTPELLRLMHEHRGPTCAFPGCVISKSKPGKVNRWNTCRPHALRVYRALYQRRHRRKQILQAEGIQHIS